MGVKEGNINKNAYNICVLLQSLTRIEVEFLDVDRSGSFQLLNSQMPFILQPFRKETSLFIDNYLREKASTDCLYHTDNSSLSYLGAGIWEKDSYKGTIVVGPFLSYIPDDSFISQIIELNKLPLGLRQQLQQYYKVLPILDISTYKNFGSIMVNLAINPLVHANVLLSEIRDFTLEDKNKNEVRVLVLPSKRFSKYS
jgi:hypothetical protein